VDQGVKNNWHISDPGINETDGNFNEGLLFLEDEPFDVVEGDTTTWSIQFNARNLYRKNGDDDIPVTINPDGRIALIRIPNERQFFLSNTFRF
jgi:hypothetical protein